MLQLPPDPEGLTPRERSAVDMLRASEAYEAAICGGDVVAICEARARYDRLHAEFVRFDRAEDMRLLRLACGVPAFCVYLSAVHRGGVHA